MLLPKLYFFFQIFWFYIFFFESIYNYIFTVPIIDIQNHRTAMKITSHQCKVIFFKNFRETEIEKIFKAYGLVNVQELDSSIIIDLKYATTDNFLKQNLYGDLTQAYLQKDVAQKLVKASTLLKQQYPHLRLVVLDAARPLSIQKIMWKDINLPSGEKEKFVANPAITSLHNYGAAVDVTLADTTGKYLDMGTWFDSFSDTAYTISEELLYKNGKLTLKQYLNRKILRKIMIDAGFYPIETEWWHFNACSRSYARNNYPLIQSHIYKENYQLLAFKNQSEKQTKALDYNVEFRIQLLTVSQKITTSSPIFKNLKVEYYQHNHLYKYTYGHYKNLQDAMVELEKLKSYGFNDAFIVAFNNHVRINMKDAIELIHEK